MNIKKIVAGIAASALAVSAMAVTASAAELKTDYQVRQYAEKININATEDGFYTQLQLGHNQKIDSLTIEYQTADGATGYCLINTGWGNNGEVECNNFKWDGGSFQNWDGAALTLPEGVAIEGTIITCSFTTDVASEWAQYNEAYPETVDEEVPSLMLLTFGANSPNPMVIKAEYAAEAPAETEAQTEAQTDAPAETEAQTNAPADTQAPADTTAAPAGNTNTAAAADKGNADTGVEGVAVVAGLAIVAAGAIVVAKKRK